MTKLTPPQIVQIWNAINAVLSTNDRLPTKFDYHTKRFMRNVKSEIEVWNGLSVEEREGLMDEEIEVPISQFSINDMPEYIPNAGADSVIDILKPLIIDFPEEEVKKESVLKSLIKEPVKNGKE